MTSHVRDAIALCEFAAHLEEEIQVNGHSNWTEISAADLLEAYRREQDLNKGLSFTTISAFGTNAAIIHYAPTPETDKSIDNQGLYMGKYTFYVKLTKICTLLHVEAFST